MNLIVRHEASEEFWGAVERYALEDVELAVRFAGEVDSSIAQISQIPIELGPAK